MTAERDSSAPAPRVLKSEIHSDLAVARRLVEEAATIFGAHSAPRPAETLYATAFLLHHFYSALESAFERVAKSLDGDLPTGHDWHRQLLTRMHLHVEDVRPAVISDASSRRLDEYRRFRHVVRHVYEHPLDEAKLESLVAGAPSVFQTLESEMEEFVEFLDELAHGVEDG